MQHTVFGKGNRGNGAYATIRLMPDGDLLFNGVMANPRGSREVPREVIAGRRTPARQLMDSRTSGISRVVFFS